MDQLTTRSQEALSDAVRRAAVRRPPRGRPDPPAARAARPARGHRRRAARRRRRRRRRGCARRPTPSCAGSRPPRAPRSPRRRPPASSCRSSRPRGDRARDLGDAYVSTEHLVVALAQVDGRGGDAAARGRGHRRRAAGRVPVGARLGAGHHAGPRGDLPGAGEVRRRPHRAGPRRASSTR